MTPSPTQRQKDPGASHHAISPPASTRLSLVPQPRQRVSHLSPLALWHLLSLDAPSVATLWTLFIAHCSRIALPWPAPAAMFVAVWMIYAADRLLDARLLDANHTAPPDLEARHRFHHQHRSRFLAAIVLGALTLTWLLHRINGRALHLYALLATLLAAWMLLIHVRPLPTGAIRRLPKELAVGIFFPAAVFIPTIARAPWLQPRLLPSATLFACVCTLNCLYLYAWEHPAPRLEAGVPNERSWLGGVEAGVPNERSRLAGVEAGVPNERSRLGGVEAGVPNERSRLAGVEAHWTTRWATGHLTHISAVVFALSIFYAAFSLPHHIVATSLPALACALSAALLFALNKLRARISPIPLRASADLVLLTPLLLLPFLPIAAR